MTYFGSSAARSADAAAGPGRVLLASPRGYCAGSDRAVVTVEKALDRYGPPVYVRQRIVHNTHVVRALERRGAVFVEAADEVPEDAVVVFSAYGAAPEVHTEAARRRLTTVDATCPLVTKVHMEARRFVREGYDILLIGHEGHEEVIGTMGEAPDRIHLVGGPDDVPYLQVADEGRVVWLSQTTLSVDETAVTVHALKARFPALLGPPGDDICYATRNRQAAVRRLAGACDLVLVIGSRNSSAAARLAEVAVLAGVPTAHLVDCAEEIDPAWLRGMSTVGLTSGASVPEILVAEALDRLAAHGFDDVEVVRATDERQPFTPPRGGTRP
ncbi:4-hydroxy-3-methylbut-2-enyl diphosphate reductase [Streptomyces albofaciens JCM 4342]|uniref:4-hydroxy-3-methylbut-2-enyl diphosphate reductase n=1 Tax=Streptomyces albofaciens TaxID=66866 RepID=UPI001239C217|nr:4-hydroxy-3-methylbut-2-enyl diphosphate reductase [Streptomyces albofaciens]KAA6212389.1 4-hydroxy-3-methylbut-2-enyl diphosphate reductase [Streptomyces albofaciens JCM 4342]